MGVREHRAESEDMRVVAENMEVAIKMAVQT